MKTSPIRSIAETSLANIIAIYYAIGSRHLRHAKSRQVALPDTWRSWPCSTWDRQRVNQRLYRFGIVLFCR
jgi:hypothetical protein